MPTEVPIIPITVGSDIVKDTSIVLRKLFPSIPAASITLKEGMSSLLFNQWLSVQCGLNVFLDRFS
jgi:hypothetical protein